jgi:hypothetical protein
MQPSTSDALETYLNTPVIPSIQDPLLYWHGMSRSNDPIAPMALNFLSTPGRFSSYDLN